MTPEGWEKKEIDAFLKGLGPTVAWWINPRTGGYGASGAGDKVVCLCGSFWSIEVKRPGKNPTAIQYRRMKEVREAGGHAVAGTAEVVIGALREWLAVRGISTCA
jgi:hypothetical protein